MSSWQYQRVRVIGSKAIDVAAIRLDVSCVIAVGQEKPRTSSRAHEPGVPRKNTSKFPHRYASDLLISADGPSKKAFARLAKRFI
jgi:hypothetical protein